MKLTRRELLTATAITAVTSIALPPLTMSARAQGGSLIDRMLGRSSQEAAPPNADASPADLAAPGPDGDVVLGSDKAPVTIVEYASMTCPHCAHFEAETFPELKKRYIDTGKVKFIFREFPLDALAAAGFMLARCAGKDKFMPIVETLFAKQADWVVKEPIAPLKAIAKQFGFTEESFDQCLANQKVLDSIQAVRDRAVQKFGVNSTPTFFVNGKRLQGDVSIDVMAKEIDPYLKEG